MRFLFIIVLFAVGVQVSAQSTWKILSKVVYKQKYFEEADYELDMPVFHPDLKALEGTEIKLKGYILALEGIKDQEHFMFSLFPFDICYFCGGAGPETVVEVFTKNEKKIKYTSKPVMIKGVLELNNDNINMHMYILRNVSLIK